MPKLTLSIDGVGRGILLLDGQPLHTAVCGVEIIAKADEVTQAKVTFGNIDIECDADCEAVSALVGVTRDGCVKHHKIKRIELADGTVIDADNPKSWQSKDEAP